MSFDKLEKIYQSPKNLKALYPYMDHHRLRDDCMTFFHWVAEGDYYDVFYAESKVKFLVKKRVLDLNYTGNSGNPLFFEYHFWLNKKYTFNIDINSRGARGNTFFHYHRGFNISKKLLKRALDMGFNINSVNNNGDTIFHDNFRFNKNTKMLLFAIKNGFDPTIKNKKGETIFDQELHGSFLELAVKYGIKPELKYYKYNITKKLINFCVNNEIDINQKDERWNTIFHRGYNYLNIEILEYAIKNGFDINSRNYNNNTIFHLKEGYYDNNEIIKMAINYGFDINSINNDRKLVIDGPKNLQFAIDNGLNIYRWHMLFPSKIDLFTIEILLKNNYNLNFPFEMGSIFHKYLPTNSSVLIHALKNGFNINKLSPFEKRNFYQHIVTYYNDINENFLKETLPIAIEYGLNIHNKDYKGYKLIDYFWRSPNMVEFIKQFG